MLGHHIGEFDVPQIIQFLKFVFSGELLYVTAIGTIKGSLIAFYWRLFSIRGRIPLLTVAGILVAWTIATVCRLVQSTSPPCESTDASRIWPLYFCIIRSKLNGT